MLAVTRSRHMQVPDIYDSAKYDSIHNRHLGLDFRDLYQVRPPVHPTTSEWSDICCDMRFCIATLLRLHHSCAPHAASYKRRCAEIQNSAPTLTGLST